MLGGPVKQNAELFTVLDSDEDEMRPNYDLRGGRRGRYAAAYSAGTNVPRIPRDASSRLDNLTALSKLTLSDLAEYLDELDIRELFGARLKLGHLYDWAQAQKIVALESAVRCEAVVLELFSSADDLRPAMVDREATLGDDDIEYLKGRAESTKSAILRAQYQYAIAWATKRFDYG